MLAADDVVVDHIFQYILIRSVRVKGIVFLEVHWKLGLDLLQRHLSPSLPQNALKHFVLVVNVRVHEPVLGYSELFIQFHLLGQLMKQHFCFRCALILLHLYFLGTFIELRFREDFGLRLDIAVNAIIRVGILLPLTDSLLALLFQLIEIFRLLLVMQWVHWLNCDQIVQWLLIEILWGCFLC